MAVLGSWMVGLLAAVIALVIFFYFYITYTYDTWKKKKIPYIQPSFPFGNFGGLITGKASFNSLAEEFYVKLKQHDFGGVYNFRTPVLIICNPDLIKRFITKDFSAFHDRGFPYDEENDPISANLFNLSGTRWKTLRAKLSPTFTSGKIKGMFPLIQECSQELRECLQEEMKKKNGSVEMKDLLIRFTTDVIGTCAFGIQCNSIKNPKSEFYLMSRDIFNLNILGILRFILVTIWPKLASVITLKRLFSKMAIFFSELMANTVKFRKENNVQRNDFVQLMMKIVDDDATEFSQDIMTAQAFLFFAAGLDNVATNIGFCLHAMAVDPDLQDRVYEEISTVLNEFKGEMSYEALGKMDLVSRVIDEGLRLYTPAGSLIRVQTEDKYVIPGTDVEIEKGTSVMIPIVALHHDEEYFPNPTKFDPDRFTEEEKQKRHPYAYIPFGEGPRFCIASRFALLEMRLCLAELVRHFRFSVAPETDLALEFNLRSPGPSPKNGFWLGLSQRKC